jgi:Ca-activated chloride channel family protein
MMTERDPLEMLKQIDPPAAAPEARNRALDAALLAFDEAQQKKTASSQGSGFGARLKSIFSNKGNWTMTDLRLPIGIAAAGLLLLPISMQLMNSTTFSGLVRQTPPVVTVEQRFEAPVSNTASASDGITSTEEADGTAIPLESEGYADAAPPPAPMDGMAAKSGAPGSGYLTREMAPVPQMMSGGAAPMDEGLPVFAGSGDRFESFDENAFHSVTEDPVSTFSIDVDTASYSYVRRSLEAGVLPPADAVRTEEMVNYFSYNYPAPGSAETPFRDSVTVYPSPWNPGTMLMHIGIKGYVPPVRDAAPANIVLLIDTSGSMDEPDKLPLLKRSFALLIDQLGARDKVSIVTYAGSAGVVLEPTAASNKKAILQALDDLWAGGSTAGAEGIEAAYALAARAAGDGTNNRVLLATDGDFNVGISDPAELERFIAKKRNEGIFLSVLGFGSGNYDDRTMQALAQNGNGTAAYIDSFREAQKVLASEVRGTLDTIAKDVKIQVEFNPQTVAEYRLIGYETRALNREDFNNDKVDAGDIGAGHTVTAIYEFTPQDSAVRHLDPLRYQSEATPQPASPADEYGFLKLRYKLPGEEESRLIEEPVKVGQALDGIAAAPEDVRFATAVASFAQKLRESSYTDAMSYADIRALAAGARGTDDSGYRAEFLSLVDLAASLSPAIER